MTLDRHPQTAVDLLVDELIRKTLDNSPVEGQRQAVRLAIEFGMQLLRLSAEHLVETISARWNIHHCRPFSSMCVMSWHSGSIDQRSRDSQC